MFNPWMLASLVFAGIGLLVELDKPGSKKPEKKPEQEKLAAPSVSVTVNEGKTSVKSETAKKVKEKKPPSKVPPEPSGDG